MKKFIVFLFCFFTGMPAFGENKGYVNLIIEEVKTDNKIDLFSDEITFSLKEAKAVFGNYNRLVVRHKKGQQKSAWDYFLETYDSKHGLIGTYVVSSGRFILWDGIKDGKMTGGLIESKKGEMDVFIPFDKNNPPHFFIVKTDIIEKNRKWKFIPLPVKKLLEQLDDREKNAKEE